MFIWLLAKEIDDWIAGVLFLVIPGNDPWLIRSAQVYCQQEAKEDSCPFCVRTSKFATDNECYQSNGCRKEYEEKADLARAEFGYNVCH